MKGNTHSWVTRRQAAGVSRLVLLFCAMCLTGCASESIAPPSEITTDGKPHPRTRSLELIVPESKLDPKSLSDAQLDSALASLNQRVNELTAQSFTHAAGFEGGDLSRDPAYRKLLLDLRTAETELGRMEIEKADRKKAERQ